MIDPNKIYNGFNSLLRNIIPGIFILFPFLLNSNVELIQKNYIMLLIIYIILSVVSHAFFEGSAVIKKNNTKDIFLFPSYQVYKNKINKVIQEKGFKSFRQYRQFQNTELFKANYGDHQIIHRITSFMICFDITYIGIFLISIINISLLIIGKENIYPLFNKPVTFIYTFLLSFIVLMIIRVFLFKAIYKIEKESFIDEKIADLYFNQIAVTKSKE